MQPSENVPPNVVSQRNEQWCALRLACEDTGNTECNLELRYNSAPQWNFDHPCVTNARYGTVHSGIMQVCQ